MSRLLHEVQDREAEPRKKSTVWWAFFVVSDAWRENQLFCEAKVVREANEQQKSTEGIFLRRLSGYREFAVQRTTAAQQVMRSRWFDAGNAAEKSTKYFSLQGAGRGKADAQQPE